MIGIVVLLVGLILALVFQPEISALMPTVSSELSPALADNDTALTDQIIDGKDVDTGLLAGDGLEIVKGNCTACHSSALILQSGFTREGWHEKIVWMQETQGLWDLGGNESIILDYLATNYGPKESHGRRMPLTGIDWYELKD
ncbi:hypothetical protein ESW18_03495 [Algoriphagus ratkowskyi]|uniref:Cytochrome c domain-containing protein n=1 Tax=Algoriphagus ratkowskyi TaxID=57028 RepID=A0ABY3HSD1_9BACT|nr:hypothetical protein ESW18_03495 [Algoriphagus ratkowskyi]